MAYVYLVMTSQIPQREYELVVAPDLDPSLAGPVTRRTTSLEPGATR